MKTKDLSFVIVFAVLNFLIFLIANQITNLFPITLGLSYIFTVLYAINASVAWLMYEGRRWRILAQAIVFNTLTAVFVPSSVFVLSIAGIVHAFTADLIFNSFYGYFKLKNKLVWWIILLQVFFWATSPLWTLVFLASLVYPLENVLTLFFIPAMTIGLPIMLIEAIAGGYIGHKIYRRVEKIKY
jgi:hypothetical protein